jgi:glycosyltransferase involved in cell wall biosynthesis
MGLAVKKRLFVITSWKIACGIASFSDALVSTLGDRFEIEIGVLDQFILRSAEPSMLAVGDRMIADLVARAKEFDAVSLQWEPGLLGLTERARLRRFRMLVQGIPNLAVTAHTILHSHNYSAFEATRVFVNHGLRAAIRYIGQYFISYANKTNAILRNRSMRGDFALIVHTKRDRDYYRKIIGVKNVSDHPLSLIHKQWDRKIPEAAKKYKTELYKEFGRKIFVGFFGFINEVKGIETLIDAVRLLPEKYILLIYGGMHPSVIPHGTISVPLVQRITASIQRKFRDAGGTSTDLGKRVFFRGSPDDFGFAVAIAACDVNVFPYAEVGQSASGPTSMSVELGKETVTTNNHMFREIEKYMPNSIRNFDIGNHVQLAQNIIESVNKKSNRKGGVAYNYRTQSDFYYKILSNILTQNRDLAKE